MARLSRIKYLNPEDGYYHITSRTVLKSFLLEETEKNYFMNLLKHLSQIYFVRVATFAVMSNHFHLVIQMVPSDKINDEELEQRFDRYYNRNVSSGQMKKYLPEQADTYRKRFGDVSCFVQDLKQRFSRWYNRTHQSHGHVWSERFKSVLLEGDRALLACMVYVELNSVRAGIVSRPEDYRYCGLHHYVAGGRLARWLNYGTLTSVLPSVASDPSSGPKDFLKRYLTIIYREGVEEKEGKASLLSGDVEETIASDFAELGLLSFRRRIRYFSDGVILGSKAFCDNKFTEFRSFFQTERERTGRLITTSHKKKRYAASPDSLLHLHSIRAFCISLE